MNGCSTPTGHPNTTPTGKKKPPAPRSHTITSSASKGATPIIPWGAFLNYTDQQGILHNTYFKRLNAKLAYDDKPTSWLSTGVNLLCEPFVG